MRAKLNVHNEVGRLRQVMLHRPGGELLNLSPSNLEPLLFDDIPFLQAAQAEHDTFAKMLRDEGVDVIYLTDLVTEIEELFQKEGIESNRQICSKLLHRFLEFPACHCDDFFLFAV